MGVAAARWGWGVGRMSSVVSNVRVREERDKGEESRRERRKKIGERRKRERRGMKDERGERREERRDKG